MIKEILVLFLGVFAIVFSYSASIAGEAQQISNLQSAGPFHPNCAKTFAKLPIDDNGNPIDFLEDGTVVAPPTLESHLLEHSDLYAQYDLDCFLGWSQLQEHTQKFLYNNVGALFSEDIPFCTAFRISRTVIVTAKHCSGQLSGSQFRLFGFPQVPLKLLQPLSLNTQAPVSSDLNDFVLWKIEKNDIPSVWSQQDFNRELRDHQAIAIVAVSLIAQVAVVGDALNNWRNAVRFSRTNSSKTWPSREINRIASGDFLQSECVYHKAATFPGMSGAPILGVSKSKFKGDSPSLFIVGIHLRNGIHFADRNDGCGQHAEFNVGIRIPAKVIQKVKRD